MACGCSATPSSFGWLFNEHKKRLKIYADSGKKSMGVEVVSRQIPKEQTVHDSRDCVVFERKSDDVYMGCARFRTINLLLGVIDSRGFERSASQEKFHDAFIRTCGKVIYREEWGVHQGAIIRHNGWNTIASGILISTPRRFGKTFR
jgi:hypothetical protein